MEDRFRSTLDNMMEGCQILGFDWQYLYINDAADIHNHRPKEELLGKYYQDMWPGIKETDIYQVIKDTLENRVNHILENQFVYPDGKVAWFDLRIQAVPEGVFILSFDITERKNNERKIHESENLFRNLFENMLNGFAYCKMIYEEGEAPDFVYLNVNKSFITLTGLKNVIGKRVSEVIPGIQEADPELINRYSKVATTGNPEVFETWVEALQMWFLISVYCPEKDHFVAVFDVITERKHAEAALRVSEDRFKYIFDHSLFGNSFTLPTGEVNINNAFSKMLGYSNEELSKLKWQDFTHADDFELTQSVFDAILSRKTDSMRFAKRYLHKDGSVIWADVSTILRYDDSGKPMYFMTSVNDITELKKTEEGLRTAEQKLMNYNKDLEMRVARRTEQLEAANRELEAFSYSVSHDLRSPLRSVHGFTKILLEDYEASLDDEGKRICRIILSSATQMGELIDDLLNFSRIGRSTMNPVILDMNSVAASAISECHNAGLNSKADIRMATLHEAHGDSSLIRHVWSNLISNALKYSSKTEKPFIEINSKRNDGMIVYSVKDNGVGFDMRYVNKLFGVFQRLHTENEFEGNGVGLAIVQRIILRHGGRVWAEGEVDKGASFYFSLPVR